MRGKLLFIAGGFVGYVLGARAGRKRYEQIVAAAENVWNADPVQRRVNEARDFALERVGEVPSALVDAGKKLFTVVADTTAKTAKNTDASRKAPKAGQRWSPADSRTSTPSTPSTPGPDGTPGTHGTPGTAETPVP
jgi:hypothetical protein